MFNTRLASSGNEYATWADSTEIYTRRDQQELNEVRQEAGKVIRKLVKGKKGKKGKQDKDKDTVDAPDDTPDTQQGFIQKAVGKAGKLAANPFALGLGIATVPSLLGSISGTLSNYTGGQDLVADPARQGAARDSGGGPAAQSGMGRLQQLSSTLGYVSGFNPAATALNALTRRATGR